MTLPSPTQMRPALELLALVANIALAVFAGLALKQLRITKRDISTRVTREAAREAAEQLGHWATDIIPAIDPMLRRHRELGWEGNVCPMERFDMEELLRTKPDVRAHFAKVQALYISDDNYRSLTMNACNLVEASAMRFMTGVADEQVAFLSLSKPLCQFVERAYPMYCCMRNKDQLNQWEYTVGLYRVWRQRRNKHDLDATQESLSEARAKAAKESARVPPLGMST